MTALLIAPAQNYQISQGICTSLLYIQCSIKDIRYARLVRVKIITIMLSKHGVPKCVQKLAIASYPMKNSMKVFNKCTNNDHPKSFNFLSHVNLKSAEIQRKLKP